MRKRGPLGRMGDPGENRGELGNRGEAWQAARGFDRDRGTQRVLAKTPQN